MKMKTPKMWSYGYKEEQKGIYTVKKGRRGVLHSNYYTTALDEAHILNMLGGSKVRIYENNKLISTL